jgi:uncharacterized protein (TIGR02145 family)
MRKLNLVKLSILKILLIGGIGVQTFSCTTNIEPPPPLSNELSSSSSNSPDAPSSSGVESSSSAVQSSSSSSSVMPSSSSVAVSSSSIAEFSSSSSVAVSSSSFYEFSSSSVKSSGSSSSLANSDLCAGFVDGTPRLHEGQDKPQFCDERDGQKYVYVIIGTQVWMAENLNYDVSNNTTDMCYNKNLANCITIGRLYDWTTVMGLNKSCNSSICATQVHSKHQGICPKNWHVPSDAEWNKLRIVAGAGGIKLMAKSGWRDNGSDEYGFSALPGGSANSSIDGDYNFINVTALGSWRSSTEFSADKAYTLSIVNSSGTSILLSDTDKASLRSVRCVKDLDE